MSYARILDDGTLVHPFRVPNVLREPDGDHDLRSGAVELLASYGIFEVVDTPRPDDTDTTTSDRSVAVVDGVPTVVWTGRPWTQAELDARQAQANESTVNAAITEALAELKQLVDFPDVPVVPAGTFTNAQLSNYLRELRDRVQQNRNGIKRVAQTLRHTIRYTRGDYDATD